MFRKPKKDLDGVVGSILKRINETIFRNVSMVSPATLPCISMSIWDHVHKEFDDAFTHKECEYMYYHVLKNFIVEKTHGFDEVELVSRQHENKDDESSTESDDYQIVHSGTVGTVGTVGVDNEGISEQSVNRIISEAIINRGEQNFLIQSIEGLLILHRKSTISKKKRRFLCMLFPSCLDV